MKNITILGATGTIGVNTLDVIAQHSDKFKVFALTANQNIEKLYQQCLQHNPQYAVVVEEEKAALLEEKLKNTDITVLKGKKALETVSEDEKVDYVMAAIVGAAGLLPSLAAAKAGKRVLLANKEALVMSGALFMQAIYENKAEILPIDSEHNAIFQSLPMHFDKDLSQNGVKNIWLTASGGPFRTYPLEQLSSVTPEQACKHPNWVMGRKISVDSATMMNKGLEVIEAHWLFNLKAEAIKVVIHPQSIIHSMVAYTDGSVLAELGNPDMRTPIAHALGFPDRIAANVTPLDFYTLKDLEFFEPDFHQFPCLALAYQALKQGGTASAILNAANEIAVEAFLNKKIAFTEIPKLIEYALTEIPSQQATHLDIILQADLQTRTLISERI